MKNILLSLFIFSSFLIGVSVTSAQMMGNVNNTQVNWNEVQEHTLREEQEGKELWKKLQAKEVVCTNLKDEQFGVLGEYYMGQMIGTSHASMNAMMIQMHGEEGEEQIHITMGKRLSGCDPNAARSTQGSGWMPMLQMMGGLGASSRSFNQPNATYMPMMWGFGPEGYGFGGMGSIFIIFWWILIIAVIVLVARWLMSQSRGTSHRNSSALDLLKERYAKGEIDKKEFEEKKKDLA